MENSKQRLRGGNFALWLVSKDFAINFALTLRVRGAFSLDQFRRALDKVAVQYPSTKTRVVREEDGSVYKILDPELKFPIREVERKDSKSWVVEVRSELPKVFDAFNEPPIRFIWVKGEDVSEIILLCDHTFVDGYSAAYVARDLLRYLEQPDIKSDQQKIYAGLPDIVPPLQGQRSAILRGQLKAALLKVLLTFSRNQEEQWQERIATEDRNYHLLPWEMTEEQTSSLVKFSRSHGTTVHAALCTAFLRAFGDLHGGSWNRKIQSPIDLRKRLTEPVGESFGLYIHLVEFLVDCSPERDFWEVAREIKHKFSKLSEDKIVFGGITELTVLMDKLASVISPLNVVQTTYNADYDLSISNLGKLDFPVQYGSLTLEALFGPAISNPGEIVLGVITNGGKMNLVMTFTETTMTLSHAEEIKEAAMKHLVAAIEG